MATYLSSKHMWNNRGDNNNNESDSDMLSDKQCKNCKKINEEENEMFLRTCLISMRKLPEIIRMSVQMEILQVSSTIIDF